MKRVLVRVQQGIRYFFINFLVALSFEKIKLNELKFPIHLRKNTSDILTFHQIFTFKEYGMNLGFVPKFIVDAGANIGLSAVFFANKFPDATIVAVEPEKSNFEMLLKNTNKYKNIFCVKKAISNQSDLSFDVVDKGFGNWGFVTQVKNNGQLEKVVHQVDSLTIDEILVYYKLECLDLLKIDIEGAEKNLFESNYENWLPKTKCIIIELHDGITKGSSKSFFAAISRYNFSYFNRGENLLFINNDLN
ncbi:FkbM family methyltransferase [Flavobacterium sp. F-328]|uniref:FkbM family methyltransferase n=1 Tax=Flavobacterium erciyesense TaxID=2825842 RepID=A0ABS5D301_9FLAO|nr:FkbM family methyltransferase [Flavobacterium erciyesense]MBQ0908387.1 FkbM family methyltransferase [Flavobacterium erciyesense]